MPNPIMKFFKYDHLPQGSDGRDMSETVCKLAIAIDRDVPDSAEKSAGLRKLLEAKDCFVRAVLEPVPFAGSTRG